jgi:tetratricopeptide (TPR) repeat protein
MTIRGPGLRNPGLALLFMALVAAAAAFVLRARLQPAPSLDGLGPLITARRFDEVEGRLRAYLRLRPGSLQANLLMAQVAIDRDDQKPRLALDHLARIKTGDRSTLAIVRLNEGKAYSALGQNDHAETAWKEALRLEPRVPEAGWDLLSLYYVQGRREPAHRLALMLHAVEPDRRDRARLLLELVRQDARPIGPIYRIRTLEPLVRAHPEDFHTAIALGLALIRNSRIDEGLSILRGLVEHHAGHPDTWDALLLGLDEARQPDELSATWDRLPAAMTGDPRFERHRAAIAQERRDWQGAAEGYLRAWRADPSDLQVLYRLSRVLQAAGRLEEARAIDLKVRAAQEAREQVLPLYTEANADKTLGVAPHPELYHRLADLREHMGRSDEALAWHRLVLQDQPDDPTSREAVARLQATIDDGTVSRR